LFRLIALFCVVSLSACSVQHNNPDFAYPEYKGSDSEDWPALLPTEQLAATNEANVGDTPNPNISLNGRIARLRAKAARLSAYRF
jgi:hypothetical protein